VDISKLSNPKDISGDENGVYRMPSTVSQQMKVKQTRHTSIVGTVSFTHWVKPVYPLGKTGWVKLGKKVSLPISKTR